MRKDSSAQASVDSIFIISVGRCAKVVSGGRRFSFRVLVVVGDGKGRVGIGQGKGLEVTSAKEKAVSDAKKNMHRVPLRENRTLHCDIIAKYHGTKIIARSAPQGTGIIAGSALRSFFYALGVKDVVAKCVTNSESYKVLKAAVKGILSLRSPRVIAESRGVRVANLLKNRQAHKNQVRESEKSESVSNSN